jgi:hypothetical protein
MEENEEIVDMDELVNTELDESSNTQKVIDQQLKKIKNVMIHRK